MYASFLDRKGGAHWKEAASTLQNIMNDYAGLDVRSDDILSTGLAYLRQLREYAMAELAAENSHELMRILEVLDMIDLGEPIFLTARNRRETRGQHRRADYTYTNLLLNNKFQTICKVGDEVVLEYRNRR